MTLDEYQRLAMRTHNSKISENQMLSNYTLGLAGEVGEVAEPIKKFLYHGKTLDKEHLAKELGDLLWYVAGVSYVLGLSLDDIAVGNIEKLKARWPEGFNK
jgi:NTP pyrophosphatase (non-canonical NTP hydrolase)